MQDDHILEGVLQCTHDGCQREYPILDGIPIIVAEIRRYMSDNILSVYGRRDLGELTESIIGDCCGPDSTLGHTRQVISSYAWDHYAESDPCEAAGQPRPGAAVRILNEGLELASQAPTGPWIDVGCAVGAGAFELARRSAELVLGIDLNFAMLRLAAEVLRNGEVDYLRRRVGVVYERRQFPLQPAGSDRVDFWACDAMALPFPSSTFTLAAGINVLDSVASPVGLLEMIAHVLAPGGMAVLACPYDWSAATTPLETWLGGHSQRSAWAGRSESVLKALLTSEEGGPGDSGLKLLAERDGLPWHVRLHDRSYMAYQLHLVIATAEKTERP